MVFLFFFILGAVFLFVVYSIKNNSQQPTKQQDPPSHSSHFDLLDEDGEPIKKPEIRVVVGGGGSDAPIQELKYFCIKDKGYHVTVWPKDYDQFDIVEFSIAGMSFCENIDNYLGEFEGTLESEPDNPYDTNAIKVLAPDGHRVGYVPKDMTSEIRKESDLPCACFFYIGCNNDIYFSEAFILRK